MAKSKEEKKAEKKAKKSQKQAARSEKKAKKSQKKAVKVKKKETKKVRKDADKISKKLLKQQARDAKKELKAADTPAKKAAAQERVDQLKSIKDTLKNGTTVTRADGTTETIGSAKDQRKDFNKKVDSGDVAGLDSRDQYKIKRDQGIKDYNATLTEAGPNGEFEAKPVEAKELSSYTELSAQSERMTAADKFKLRWKQLNGVTLTADEKAALRADKIAGITDRGEKKAATSSNKVTRSERLYQNDASKAAADALKSQQLTNPDSGITDEQIGIQENVVKETQKKVDEEVPNLLNPIDTNLNPVPNEKHDPVDPVTPEPELDDDGNPINWADRFSMDEIRRRIRERNRASLGGKLATGSRGVKPTAKKAVNQSAVSIQTALSGNR